MNHVLLKQQHGLCTCTHGYMSYISCPHGVVRILCSVISAAGNRVRIMSNQILERAVKSRKNLGRQSGTSYLLPICSSVLLDL